VVTHPSEQAKELEGFARARFGELSQAELKVLRAAPHGEWAVCGSGDPGDATCNPAHADEWGPDRQIRAEVIRWLCVDGEARSRVDRRGIRVLAAKIVGELDLSFVSVPFPIGLLHCRLTHDADLTSVEIPALVLAGTWVRSLSADCATVEGSVFLRGGFTAEGVVRLLGAQIGSDLDCDGGTFKNPEGKALGAADATVKGDVYFGEGFTAQGEVWLVGTQIRGQLACSGGSFTKLIAQHATVQGALFWLNIKHADGAVLDLRDASVGSIDDEEASWPAEGNLFLDGFLYDRIGEGPTDASTRL
jgi:hypothetical protein